MNKYIYLVILDGDIKSYTFYKDTVKAYIKQRKRKYKVAKLKFDEAIVDILIRNNIPQIYEYGTFPDIPSIILDDLEIAEIDKELVDFIDKMLILYNKFNLSFDKLNLNKHEKKILKHMINVIEACIFSMRGDTDDKEDINYQGMEYMIIIERFSANKLKEELKSDYKDKINKI